MKNNIYVNTNLLIEFIEKNNLTKQKLAENCKVSLFVLNKLFSGKTNIRLSNIYKIALYTKIKIDDLIIFD